MLLKNQLESAFEKSSKALDRFVWKLPKRLNKEGRYEQDSIRLIDATDDQLRNFHQHCLTMLRNTDPKFPGREVLLRTIKEQIVKCNAELFFRVYAETGEDRETFLVKPIKDFITASNLTDGQAANLELKDVANTSDEQFASIPVKHILDAGEGKLGFYNRAYMTLTFLLNKGLKFSEKEREIYDLENEREILKKVREDLNLKDDSIPLNFNRNTGMTVEELKYMLPLKKKRYEDIPTEILYLLRDRLLVYLKEDVEYHINQWNERIGWLEAVAEDRGIKL